MLTIRNFRKVYVDRTILDIPRLDFAPGIHWVQGRNGSGKTTFFKSIAGMLPFDGQIILDGQFDADRHPVPYRLRVNYGEAEPVFPEFLTAHELIQWVGTAKKATQSQTDELVDAFAVREYMKTPVGTYSSGMLKKTSLVLAFLGQPRLILLDEPLITLDVAATQTVAHQIRMLSERGVSFLLSSHQDFSLAELPIASVWQVDHQTVTPVT
ncbi:MAG: ABC transporter ATP-binding protein [Bacteroidetes bacterium]|nr:ABC transporter ATP-binding protein [Fibrella sp.]